MAVTHTSPYQGTIQAPQQTLSNGRIVSNGYIFEDQGSRIQIMVNMQNQCTTDIYATKQ